MLKRKPPTDKHQMLPYYLGKYEHIQNNIDFESAKNVLMKEDYKMIVKRRFERIYNMMLDFKSYSKNEDIPENKEIFFILSNLFKQIKSIILSWSDLNQMNYTKMINYSISGLIN